MLPLNEAWYRRLLLAAVVLGVAGGVAALGYSSLTTWGIDRLFGDPTSEPWSGLWWWILLVPGGAIIVTFLRKRWRVPDDVPGAIALARRAKVEPASAPGLIAVSVVSLIAGASLGPSFGIIVAGGGMGTWLASKMRDPTVEGEQSYTLTGMAGSLGAVFSAPLFASILATELSPTPKKNYAATFIPQFLAASLGFVIFFGVTGNVMLDAFDVSGYEFETIHLLLGVPLGVFAALTLLLHVLIGHAVRKATSWGTNAYLTAAGGGALIGLIAFALPLTATGGSSQLAFATGQAETFGLGLLALVLLGKMVAVTLSQEVGFLGGTVFPILFIGGTAGIFVHGIFPDIPLALAVAAMISAVPGAVIAAPASFILIGFGGVGLGIEAIAPIGIAVITAYLIVASIRLYREGQEAM